MGRSEQELANETSRSSGDVLDMSDVIGIRGKLAKGGMASLPLLPAQPAKHSSTEKAPLSKRKSKRGTTRTRGGLFPVRQGLDAAEISACRPTAFIICGDFSAPLFDRMVNRTCGSPAPNGLGMPANC